MVRREIREISAIIAEQDVRSKRQAGIVRVDRKEIREISVPTAGQRNRKMTCVRGTAHAVRRVIQEISVPTAERKGGNSI